MRELQPKLLRKRRVDLERVPEAELPVRQPGLEPEALVEQLAHDHRVCRVNRVRGGQVVVLAGVDDNAGTRMDLSTKPLIDKCTFRVDVAENDAVHAVVEHHVESFEPG